MDDVFFREHNPIYCLIEKVLTSFQVENPKAVSEAVVEAIERSDYAIVPVGDWLDGVVFDE